MEQIRMYAMSIIIAYLIGMVANTYTCMTTFLNDSVGKIGIFNKNDETFMIIAKNKKRRFGNQHKHAFFAIYMQQPKTHVWSPVYTCKQNDCGNNGNVQLRFSEVEHGIEAANMFTITKNEPHAPMVQKLPMIKKKKNCYSCGG